MTEPLWVRCSLDIDHEPHPHPGGQCDGVASPSTGGTEQPGSIASLLGASGAPRPYFLPSLTAAQRAELAPLLIAFVDHLNREYAVQVTDVVLPCWPKHPRLVHELAALYSLWIDGHQALAASPERAMYWHDRWLPNFFDRVRSTHFGHAPDICTAAKHRDDWCAAATVLTGRGPADPDDVFAHLGDAPALLEGDAGA